MDKARLDDLVTEYARRMTYLTEDKRVQWRGNVLSDLLSTSMTWSTFLRGIRCLNMRKMGFTLKLHHLNIITEHTFIKEFPGADVDVESTPESGQKPPTELHLFFTSIMRDLGVSVGDVQTLLTRYMIRARVPMTTDNRTNVRGNIKKELFGERLTWPSFIRGLNFLELTKFELIVTLTPKTGRGRSHRRIIVLNDADDLRDELLAIVTNKDASNEPTENDDRDSTRAAPGISALSALEGSAVGTARD